MTKSTDTLRYAVEIANVKGEMAMRKLLFIVSVVVTSAVVLSGCKTMDAVGEDLSSVFDKSDDSATVSVPSDRRQMVREVQQMLTDRGYKPGPVDGLEGPSTRTALRDFQSANGLEVTPGVTDEAYIQLTSENRKNHSPSEVKAESNSDARECARNFNKPRALRYQTTAVIQGVSKATAVDRLVRIIGRNGFVVSESDRSRGFVSGSFDAGDSGLQLSAFIEQSGRGLDVELNYVVTGASLGSLFVPSSAYKNDMCRFIEAMRTGA